MNKKIKLGAFIMAILVILQLNTIMASETNASNMTTLTSGSALDVQLIGRVNSNIVSAIMPTQVRFLVIPENDDWNKVLSPDITIRNTGNVMLNVSVTKAKLNTANVQFTSGTPMLNGATRQVRLAIAPKSGTHNASSLAKYYLTNSVSDSNSIVLTDGLDYGTSTDSATYNVYGDISSGWNNGDELSVSTVFKISLH